MTEFQKIKIEYLFSVLDSNGNQILQPDDFTGVAENLSDILGYEKDSKLRLELKLRSYRLFVQILADIGKEEINITLDEWRKFFSFIGSVRPQFIKRYVTRVVNYFFSLFDENGDSLINRQEYGNMFKAYGIDQEYLEVAFNKLDENSDDYINKDELINGFYDFFLSSDPESPGNWIFGNWEAQVVHS